MTGMIGGINEAELIRRRDALLLTHGPVRNSLVFGGDKNRTTLPFHHPLRRDPGVSFVWNVTDAVGLGKSKLHDDVCLFQTMLKAWVDDVGGIGKGALFQVRPTGTFTSSDSF